MPKLNKKQIIVALIILTFFGCKSTENKYYHVEINSVEYPIWFSDYVKDTSWNLSDHQGNGDRINISLYSKKTPANSITVSHEFFINAIDYFSSPKKKLEMKKSYLEDYKNFKVSNFKPLIKNKSSKGYIIEYGNANEFFVLVVLGVKSGLYTIKAKFSSNSLRSDYYDHIISQWYPKIELLEIRQSNGEFPDYIEEQWKARLHVTP